MFSAAVIAIFVCLSFLSPRVAGAQAPTQKLSISMSSTGMPSIQLFIAREKGFFREEGFDPQLIRMSANAAIAAGVAGELDALESVGSAVRGIMRMRSEERRVGKECRMPCRSRWSPYH